MFYVEIYVDTPSGTSSVADTDLTTQVNIVLIVFFKSTSNHECSIFKSKCMLM